ncbi:MAG TPA: glycosyltransferase, partial [Gemmataceae bacterium]
GPGEYLAFLGRIAPEKRPDRAIDIARRTGIPLKIAAKVDPADRKYFHREIEPLLRESADVVEVIGEIGEAQKAEFLGKAKALLFPIDWPEPFGLVMIESLACGTPVIAYPRGSVPEVLRHGRTGFLVESQEEAAEAVRRIGELDRAECRRAFEERFSARRMASDYLRVYRQVLARHAGRSAVRDPALPALVPAADVLLGPPPGGPPGVLGISTAFLTGRRGDDSAALGGSA